ncbi:MAG: coenzyme F420-0:L-glutamate ligase [bacterium]
MHVVSIKTHPLRPVDKPVMTDILDKYIPKLTEKSVVVVTSKIVAICEGSYIKTSAVSHKEALVPDYADLYTPAEENKYGFCMTITDSMLVASAGIDESNGDGYYILWPKDAYASAAQIWTYLRARDGITQLGVVLSDSCTRPLRWGVTAQAISYCGFEPLKDYRGTPDIFKRNLKVTKMNIADHLASTGAFAMGEGDECTPFALVTDTPHVVYVDRPPSTSEIEGMRISLDEDLYGSILKRAPWRKGKKRSS